MATDDGPAAILQQALGWADAGETVALVTVASAWAMAPRRAGSQMAVRGDGEHRGTVFGGGVDAKVVAAARAALADGHGGRLDLAVADDEAGAAGLACGGRLDLRIECLDGRAAGDAGGLAALREARAAIAARRSVVLCTPLGDGRRTLVEIAAPGSGALAEEACRRALSDDTAVVDIDGSPVLFQVFNAPLRLFIVGAVDTAFALARAARLVGFRVTIADPRPERAPAPQPEAFDFEPGEPGRALAAAGLDTRTAVVALSHTGAIDDPALSVAVASPAFYVGALGSRRTHAARLERLHQAGVPEALTARIHGPAGLSIGAIGSAEIAASIVAEIVSVLRAGRRRSA